MKKDFILKPQVYFNIVQITGYNFLGSDQIINGGINIFFKFFFLVSR
jgi:hypothetical protein